MKAVADSDYPVPAALSPVLRNYQKTGYRWLKTMETAGFGGILADDMGLGKTLQVIALLLNAREEGNDLPSLVVCPASLVLNWESEIRRFAPQLTVLPILGDAEQRAASLRRTAGYDVVVTSYDLLKRDIERYAAKEFRYHILDEAQVIKNHNTQNAKAVKAIRSRQRFALTGTPHRKPPERAVEHIRFSHARLPLSVQPVPRAAGKPHCEKRLPPGAG